MTDSDQTDRLRAERDALAEQLDDVTALLEQAREGVLVATLATTEFRFANRRICEILGYEREELLEMSVADIHPPEAMAEVTDAFERQARGELDVAVGLPVKHKNGNVYYADISSSQVRFGGEPCLVGLFHDVTSRVEEEAVRRREQAAKDRELSQVADMALLARDAMELVELDVDADLYLHVAQRLEELVGDALVAVAHYDASDNRIQIRALLGVADRRDELAELLDGEPEGLSFELGTELREALSRGELIRFEQGVFDLTNGRVPRPIAAEIDGLLRITSVFAIGLARDGELYGSVAIAPFDGDELAKRSAIEVLVAQATVAVARRRTEQALRDLETQLRHMQKMEAVGTLAGGVAHDFNNLLTAILAYAEDLQLISEPGDEVHEAAVVIENAGTRAAELTQKLLGFARQGKLRIEPVDLHQLIQDVVAVLSRTIDRRITISQSLAPESLVIQGDASQLQQVLLNLGINARDAMPEGGELQFETEMLARREGEAKGTANGGGSGHVRVSVRDTGTGIPIEIRERIFEPFFTTKEQGKGSGMGLAMVYGIVESHGGRVEVESTVGQGSTFRVVLPLPEKRARDVGKRGTTRAPRGERILVVDDEQIIRDLAARLLTRLGYEVLVAEDGAAGVEVYRERWQEVDLVIVDLVMPKMNGRDCFRRLKEINPEVKALLSSGYALQADVRALLSEGMIGVVKKPYAGLDISEAVAAALGAGD